MLPDEAQADTAITIFVDADACPVKDEVYKVAQRYKVKVYVVANAPMMVPKTPAIERILVAEGQPDGLAALERRDHRRPQAVHTARSLDVSVGAGPGDQPAAAARVSRRAALGLAYRHRAAAILTRRLRFFDMTMSLQAYLRLPRSRRRPQHRS